MTEIRYIESGDSALFCEFGTVISTSTSEKVLSLHRILKKDKPKGIIETVPSYTGIMIYFDPLRIPVNLLKQKVEYYAREINGSNIKVNRRKVIIPVCYSQDFGPDLNDIALDAKCSINDVINLHTEPLYHVFMIGFTPGFPYMGGLDKRLARPRKEKPALKIRAGSVGIGGEQTGIYPADSPGGWNIIGKTPLCLFDSKKKDPSLLRAGDLVKFRSISIDEYFFIGEKVRDKIYKPEISLTS